MVYFLQHNCSNNYIKIGKSGSVVGRIQELRVSTPYKLTLIAQSANYNEVELHEKFKHLRVRGEWFKPEPELLKFIQTIKEGIPSPNKKIMYSKERNENIIQTSRNHPEYTLAKIAEDYGITKERVRQILGKKTCLERLKIKRVFFKSKHLQDRWKHISESLFVKEASLRGFSIEEDKSSSRRSLTSVLINGKKVKISKTPKVREGSSICIGKRKDTEFIGCILPDGRAFIVPTKIMKNGALFQPNLKNEMGFKGRINWREYIDAWHLLQ